MTKLESDVLPSTLDQDPPPTITIADPPRACATQMPPHHTPTTRSRRVNLGGLPVDLVSRDSALDVIDRSLAGSDTPLLIASANLDKLTHFGRGAPDAGFFDRPLTRGRWLVLLDGSPMVNAARRLTGTSWPRLAGSDLLEDILADLAERHGTLAVLGGSPETHEALDEVARRRFAGLNLVGSWAPSPEELADPARSAEICDEIDGVGADVLILAMSGGRMERWARQWAVRTGVKVVLCFGAALDYTAGTQRRAPEWVRDRGVEWAWRLAAEPRRLMRRYLWEGPRAWLLLRRHSNVAAG